MRLTHRFEPARRPSTIGFFKPNTRGSEKLPIHPWGHLTPQRYKLRAVLISSTVFLRPEGIKCSADLTLVRPRSRSGLHWGLNRQSVNPAGSSPGCPDAKVRMSQPSWVIYHN